MVGTHVRTGRNAKNTGRVPDNELFRRFSSLRKTRTHGARNFLAVAAALASRGTADAHNTHPVAEGRRHDTRSTHGPSRQPGTHSSPCKRARKPGSGPVRRLKDRPKYCSASRLDRAEGTGPVKALLSRYNALAPQHTAPRTRANASVGMQACVKLKR